MYVKTNLPLWVKTFPGICVFMYLLKIGCVQQGESGLYLSQWRHSRVQFVR